MDIFKLLSRSTKFSKKSGSNATKLPSAGTVANPQLYNDPVEARGKKRKLNDVKEDNAVALSTNEEVDFFASKADLKKKAKKQRKEKKDAEYGAAKVEPAPVQLLDEDECRGILKSHRVKIMLLPGQPKEQEKTKKKSSKKRKAEKVVKKEETKQIYPQPLQAFSELQTIYGISKRLGENLVAQGYKIPTEVQMGSLPLLTKPDVAMGPSLDEEEGHKAGVEVDLLAVAPTGSGKTLAFLIPVVHRMMQRRRQEGEHDSHRLEAVVVAPTKELASQIVNEGRKMAAGTGIKVVEMMKGMRIVEDLEVEENAAITTTEAVKDADNSADSAGDSEDDERPQAKKITKQPVAKADILVTTPLALLNALSRSPIPTVRHLILDEADVLLDPLFRDQTLGIWRACTSPQLRVTLWSATMGSNIESLAVSTIRDRQHRLSLPNQNPIVRLVVGLKDSAIPNIDHKMIYTATEAGKLLALRQLIRPAASSTNTGPALRPPFLVFVQTIPRAIALHSELLYDIPAEAGGSSRIAVLHSDLSSTIRSSIMTRFRAGEIWVLITTDILSRGVDFRGINGVVNYDVPNSGATYVHRVGRTGRAGRDGGVAVTFYTKEDIPYVRNIATIIAASEKAAGKVASEAGVQQWLLDALPKVSKKDRQDLKVKGVAVRRVDGNSGDKDGKGKKGDKGRISSKSGYERKVENRKKGAIEGSKRRKENEGEVNRIEEADGEWGGIDE